MPDYEWVNEQGEIRVTQSYNEPPKEKGIWKRKFSFGVAQINGAGGSPSRISK